MKRKFLIVSLLISLLIPNKTKALINETNSETGEEGEVVALTKKYYKTVTTYNSNVMYTLSGNDYPTSITTEITEEEYNNANVNTGVQPLTIVTVETTYKELTSTISANGTYYRYKAVLNWKNFPTKRSHDIIGIGHYTSVTVVGGTDFEQYYCFSDGSCYTTALYYPQSFTAGEGASFKLPDGSLTALKQTFYFDARKTNSSSTLTYQECAADYAHATSTVSANNAMNYTVGLTGIQLASSLFGKYDEMPEAVATWTGTW